MAELTQARAKELFNYDPITGKLTWRERPSSEFHSREHAQSWNSRYAGREAGGIHAQFKYRRVRLGDSEWKAHRIIWLWVHGREPSEYMDHINGVRDDNRLENLREVNPVENARNMAMSGRNTSAAVGVAFIADDNVWRAYIGAESKSVDLGSYKTFEEAYAARKGAEKVLGYHPNHGRISA